MKNVRKFLPALAMLIVSALMLSTASLAWFAMNDVVTAENMSVTIRSESVYLVIAAVDADDVLDADDVRTNGDTSDDGIAIGSTDLLPAAYYQNGQVKGADDFYVQNASQLALSSSWYTAPALSSGSSAIDTSRIVQLDDGFDGYVVRYRYYVTLSTGSDPVNNMQVKNVSVTKGTVNEGTDITPVKVVVACNGVFDEYSSAKTSSTTDFLPTQTLTSANVAEITVYVYYDGNASTVYTENLADLSDANITFQLKVGSDPVSP